MMKAEPVADVTRNTHNYFAQGGNELVIGGKLTFLPGAIIEGGDDLFGQSEPASQIACTICTASTPWEWPSTATGLAWAGL